MISDNKKDWPKISIVMPSYNQSNFIEKSIQSVISQDYQNKEFILIDGGSDDGTVEIIEKYSDKFDYFVSESDRCQNEAVNKGMLKATGDYIGWLNSDDTYEPNALNKVGEYLRENPEIDLLYGQATHMDKEGNVLSWHAEPYDEDRLFHHRDIIPTQACFFRRKCLAYTGMLDTSLKWNGDWDLWRKFAKYFEVSFLDEHLGNWRIHDESISYGEDRRLRSLETLKSAHTHSKRLIAPIEIRLIPYVLIDLLHLRPRLRKVRDFIFSN